jgi:hypothetical protein
MHRDTFRERFDSSPLEKYEDCGRYIRERTQVRLFILAVCVCVAGRSKQQTCISREYVDLILLATQHYRLHGMTPESNSWRVKFSRSLMAEAKFVLENM